MTSFFVGRVAAFRVNKRKMGRTETEMGCKVPTTILKSFVCVCRCLKRRRIVGIDRCSNF